MTRSLFLFFQDQDCAHDPAACRKPTNQSPATCRAHSTKLVATLSSELSPQHEKLSISVELGTPDRLAEGGVPGKRFAWGAEKSLINLTKLVCPGRWRRVDYGDHVSFSVIAERW